MNKVMTVIYISERSKKGNQSLDDLFNFLIPMAPTRIMIALDRNSEEVSNFIQKKFPGLPVDTLECNISGTKDQEVSAADLEVKRKILSLGIETLAKYVDSNFKNMYDLNSEVTVSLFRAFFQFYSNAMPSDYEVFYEYRRLCILGKIVKKKPENGDILIVSPWDAYWFMDELEKS